MALVVSPDERPTTSRPSMSISTELQYLQTKKSRAPSTPSPMAMPSAPLRPKRSATQPPDMEADMAPTRNMDTTTDHSKSSWPSPSSTS